MASSLCAQARPRAFVDVGATWHVMAGCWGEGGWQHIASDDLVRWSLVTDGPRAFGGSGGAVEALS